MKRLIVLVERIADGSTFEQEIELRENESIKHAINRYINTYLGKKYYQVCNWYTID